MTKQKVIRETEYEKIVQYFDNTGGAETTYCIRYQKVYGKTRDGKLVSKWVVV